ncbi:unnamed protein product [Parascedosporium putredinis]|uniref:Uncharacterized protein n=1 Tax=Parascedosporium putredinis TaxID=1442378 RepID=A0A9P1H0Z9_9PEZI|nr:unnamed protein product [Parascedosporium putredinis]CAI7992271.1 unnamed protein product [Parascedosporium putredinis]
MVGRGAGKFAMNGFTGDEVAVGYAADARQGPLISRASTLKLPIKISTDPSFSSRFSAARSRTRSLTAISPEDNPARQQSVQLPPSVLESPPLTGSTPTDPISAFLSGILPETLAADNTSERPAPLRPNRRPSSPSSPLLRLAKKQPQQPRQLAIELRQGKPPPLPFPLPRPRRSPPGSRLLVQSLLSSLARRDSSPVPKRSRQLVLGRAKNPQLAMDTAQAYTQGNSQAANRGPIANLPLPNLSGQANGVIGNLLKGPVGADGKLKDAALMVGIKLDLEAEVHLTARIRAPVVRDCLWNGTMPYRVSERV